MALEYFQVLHDKEQLQRYDNILRNLGLRVHDSREVWNISNVTAALRNLSISKNARILDLGTYKSSTLQGLHLAGYENLYGVDLSRDIYNEPFYNAIRYIYGDIGNTHFPASFFDSVLCLKLSKPNLDFSFFQEISRILKPNSHLMITINFEPEKKQAPESKWNIFSSEETLDLIKIAKNSGLVPLFTDQELNVISNSKYPSLQLDGFNYSLAFLCFINAKEQERQLLPRKLSVLSYSDKLGGISEYVKLLCERLEKESLIHVENVHDSADVTTGIVLIEYASGIQSAERLLSDVRYLWEQNKKILIEIHDSLQKLSKSERKEIELKAILLYRANEIASFDKVRNYCLFPHISYTNVPIQPFQDSNEIYLGSFGFGINAKRFGELISLSKRLNVRAKFLISKNDEYGPGNRQFSSLVSKLKNDPSVAVLENENQAPDYDARKIIVKTGFFSIEEIEKELGELSHLVFAHRSFYSNSGTMTLAKRLSKPIVALDSFQARQAQAIRVKIFSSRSSLLKEEIVLLGAVFLRKVGLKPNFVDKEITTDPKAWFRTIIEFIRAKSPSLEFLQKCSHELSRDEDGLPYLSSILENINAK